MRFLVVACFAAISWFSFSVFAGSKTKPHAHQGLLEPYDGRHISYNITVEQNEILELGQPVSLLLFVLINFG